MLNTMSWQHIPQQGYHMQHVSTNTSPRSLIQSHGTGNAAGNGPVSSFQTPAIAGQAMPLAAYRPAINQSAASNLLASINQENQVVGAVRSSSLRNKREMGHGFSKPTPPLPGRSSTSPASQVNDVVATSPIPGSMGNAAGANKLKRPTKSSAETTTTTSKRPLPKIPINTLASGSIESPTKSPPRPSQQSSPSTSLAVHVLNNPLMISPPNTSVPLSPLPASPSGRPEPPPKDPLAAPGSPPNPKSPSSLPDVPPAPSNRSSVIPLSPAISSAVNFMMMEWQEQSPPKRESDAPVTTTSLPSPPLPLSPAGGEEESADKMADKDNVKDKEPAKRLSGGTGSTTPDKREMKESWRKSDSTNSHHTVRQSASWASRPVSWAESFHSAYTIVPPSGGNGALQLPTNKRLSALIADADFGMPEEEPEEDVGIDYEHVDLEEATPAISTIDPKAGSNEAEAQIPPPVPHKPSKDSIKMVNRRSISLSSALQNTVVNFLGGAVPGKPHQAQIQTVVLPTSISTTASASAVDVRKVSHSISGFESLNVTTSQLSPQNNLPQHSEALQPLTPLRPSGVPLSNYHVSPVSISPSQPSFRSPSSPSFTSLPSPQTQPPSATTNIKGKIHAFLPALPKGEQKLPAISSHAPAPANISIQPDSPSYTPPTSAFVSNSSHTRQQTLSGLGPSAAGLAKRAVERMGKRWGDMMSGLSSSSTGSSGQSSGFSSATSVSTSMTSGISSGSPSWADGTKPALGPGSPQVQGPGHTFFGSGLVKTSSNSTSPVYGHTHHQSVVHTFLPGPSKSGGHKRTTKSLGTTAMDVQASCCASSSTLASTSGSASISDSDPFCSSGPVLGRQLRGPLRNGKLVFGKELESVVRETRIVVQKESGNGRRKQGLIKELEERVLPALVVRCAQHLLIWGVQEEGLFRVNGRPRHVRRLRAEFDAGVDYDMMDCSPGDLDPHAVASVFKAFLRELPDSILTQKLQPYFDAAINKESSMIISEHVSKSMSGKGLPTNAKGGLSVGSVRKPPSLSTLAMPTFSQVPPPSRPLVHAIRSLIVQLPPENRDLIRTVVDLIKATAEESKATKMPLSNLLLVFCPSLNMSPPLLRALCEAEGIWIEEDKIIDIKRRRSEDCDSMVDSDDDVPPPTPEKGEVINIGRDVIESDLETSSGLDEEGSLLSSDNPSSLDYHASAEGSSFSEERSALLKRRNMVLNRSEVPTVYLDTRSHLSISSSMVSFQDPLDAGDSQSGRDSRDDGSVSSGPYSLNNLRHSPSPPPLSTSAESVSTPTSSANPSFADLPLEQTDMIVESQRNELDLSSIRTSPQIIGSEHVELRKRPKISNPIPISGPMQFPFPTTPTKETSGAPTLSKRRSIPLLSLSNLSSQASNAPRNRESTSSSGSPARAEFRQKKPSLRLLFSKKSTSSLLEDKEQAFTEGISTIQQASQDRSSGSDSSISTPLSAVTAPQTSSGVISVSSTMKDNPPVLDTLIEDSSFKIDDFLDVDAKTPSSITRWTHEKDGSPDSEDSQSLSSQRASKNPTPPSQESSFNFINQAPSRLASPVVEPLVVLPPVSPRSRKDVQLSPKPQLRLHASTTSLSLLDLGPDSSLGKKDEDWMRSVLIAADVFPSSKS